MHRPAMLLCLAVAFAAGFASSHVVERSANAQASPLSSTVYIPSDGLVFRTFEGRVAARLSYGSRGGVFELFDEHEQPASAVRAGTVLSAPSQSPPLDAQGAGKRDLGI